MRTATAVLVLLLVPALPAAAGKHHKPTTTTTTTTTTSTTTSTLPAPSVSVDCDEGAITVVNTGVVDAAVTVYIGGGEVTVTIPPGGSETVWGNFHPGMTWAVTLGDEIVAQGTFADCAPPTTSTSSTTTFPGYCPECPDPVDTTTTTAVAPEIEDPVTTSTVADTTTSTDPEPTPTVVDDPTTTVATRDTLPFTGVGMAPAVAAVVALAVGAGLIGLTREEDG